MMANFQPPPGFVFDPNSGLYYQSVPGNDPVTRQTGNWITWFNTGTGEYTQQFYPAAPVAPVVQQQQYATPQSQRLNPMLFLIPVASLVIGMGLAFILYGRDTPSGNDGDKSDLVVVADIGGDADNTSMPTPSPSPSPFPTPYPTPTPEPDTLQSHDAGKANELAIMNELARDLQRGYDENGLNYLAFVRDNEFVMVYRAGFSMDYSEAERRHRENIEPDGFISNVLQELWERGVASPVFTVEYWDENNRAFYSKSYRTLTDREKVILRELVDELNIEARRREENMYAFETVVGLGISHQFDEDFGIDYADLEVYFRRMAYDRTHLYEMADYMREKGIEYPAIITEFRDKHGVLMYREEFR